LRSRVIFLISRLIPNLLGLLTNAVLTRLLAPPEYGLYALGVSVTFFLTLSVFEWLGLSLLRMAPAVERPDLFFGTVQTCFRILCGLCAVATLLIVPLAGLGNYAFLIAGCLFATFASAWFELRQRLQLAELRGADYFWTSAARGVTSTIFVCGAAYIYQNPPQIIFALAVSLILAGFTIRERRFNLLNWRFDWEICRTLFRFGLPLSISVGLVMILASIDKWLLQLLSGSGAVGLFTAGTLVAQVPVLALAGGIGTTAYSMAVHALEFRSAEAARAQLAQNFVILLGIVVPGAAGIIALSHNLAHLIVGAAYWHSVVLLTPWLSAVAVLSSIRSFYVETAFQLAHKTLPLVWAMLFTVVVNVGFNLWLIPTYHELGAAMGSCGASVIGFVVVAFASRSVYHLPIPVLDSAKVLASTGIMVLVLLESARFSGVLALAGQLTAGMLVYAASVVAFDILGARNWLIAHSRGWVRPLWPPARRAGQDPD
jgi:O-antigen/teichoic acid export membrane protein